MIVERGEPWRHVALGKTRQMFPYLLNALLISWLYYRIHWHWLDIGTLPLTVLGTALTIFLSFRINAAYARWWEARTLWGGIINASRTWARQILTYPQSAIGDGLIAWERLQILRQIDLVHAMRCHLRGQERPELRVTEGLPPLDEIKHLPQALLLAQARALTMAAERAWLEPLRFTQLQATLGTLTDLLGGCERIKNTPLPKQLTTMPRVFVGLVCAVIPLVLVQDLGWLTPPVCGLLAFLFLTLDEVGRNVEAPFANTVHDIPLTTMCLTIESNLCEMLGEVGPEVPKPVQGVLM